MFLNNFPNSSSQTSKDVALPCLSYITAGILLFFLKAKRLDLVKTLLLFAFNVFSSIKGDEQVVVVAIGAEGGISEDECSFLKKQGFTMLYFGENILRAETASIYALSALREAYIEKKRLLKDVD